MKVFINPGHSPNGNPDPGAPGFGKRECDIALDISNKVKQLLVEKGFGVDLLQSHYLEDVCALANSNDADLFVSIHCNAFNSIASGVETLYYPGSYRGQLLSTKILNQITKQFPQLINRGIKERSDLYVLNNTAMPATLVETAFIDNANDNKLLVNNQDEFAIAISNGIIDYCNDVLGSGYTSITNDSKVYIEQIPKVEETRDNNGKRIITPEDIAKYVSQVLVNTGIEGKFDDITKSSKSDYPSIGCSQWLYDRADNILKKIPGGNKFVGMTYSTIINNNYMDELKRILASPEGQKVQMDQLYEDCLNYVNDLRQIWYLDDTRCLIYAATWATTSLSTVHKFVEYCRGHINIRSLLNLTDRFANQYREYFGVDSKYQQGYFNRAYRTYYAVAEIDLTTPFGIPEYGKGEFGR